MDEKNEGWMGIPHGGIGMGAIMELAGGLDNYPHNDDLLYPLSAEFRMGGSSVKIGNTLDVTISAEEGGAQGVVILKGQPLPYISATIDYGKDEPQRRDLFSAYIPEKFSAIEHKLVALPYYENCFVCGVARRDPGLKRRFYLVNNKPPEKALIVSMAGFHAEDDGNFFLFQQKGTIHPIAPMAVLDETLGWAGFLSSASGAVTVQISYTFYRAIKVGEKLVFFGRSERVRGRPRARFMFWSSGGAAVVDEKGKFDAVITTQGQWMGVPELTEQMHRELIPKGLVVQVLEIAGNRGDQP